MEERSGDLDEHPSTEAGHQRRWLVSIGCLLAVAVASLGFAACSSTPSSSSSGHSASSTPVVDTAKNTKYGTILVDTQGATLYTLANAGKPIACEATCTHVWPPLLVPAGAKTLTGSGVNGLGKSSSGTVVTYQGFPLFRYSGDTSVGETNGNGINSYGGTWYVIKVGEKPGTPVTG
jgi:predicted lipoprotein with Yx(FWY)xxD motif